MTFKELCHQLQAKIQQSYTEGTTLDEAEKLAAEFLHAMMTVSAELKTVSLDARMRKSGTKAARAGAYLDIVGKSDKKPTEAQIGATIDMDALVNKEQDALDHAEVDKEELERYYDIFNNAHIYYRGIAKGNFNG